MTVKVNGMKDFRNSFKRELKQVHKKEMQKVGEEVSKIIEEKLNQTIDKTGQTNEDGFRSAVPETISKVNNSTNGSEIKLKSFMSNGSGSPHIVWHSINRGKSSYVAQKGFVFDERKNTRTTPGSLGMKSFSGYTGRKVYVPENTRIKGYDPRNYYKTITEELIKEIKKELKENNITFNVTFNN